MRSKILYFLLIQIMALGTTHGAGITLFYYHFTPSNVTLPMPGLFFYLPTGSVVLLFDKQAAFTSRPFTYSDIVGRCTYHQRHPQTGL
ncbi:MAG: hypothetical protein IPL08_13155 [Saprospiraceae bacterium]|nr:hypothetical protein [Saprospiraceae bacterium]